MSTAKPYVSFLLDAGNEYEPRAQAYRDGGAIGSVNLGGNGALCIQSRDPLALRNLAAALVEAAAKADAIIAQGVTA